MSALLLLSVLTQANVAAAPPWRTYGEDGSVCVAVPQADGTLTQHCRSSRRAYGEEPTDAGESAGPFDESLPAPRQFAAPPAESVTQPEELVPVPLQPAPQRAAPRTWRNLPPSTRSVAAPVPKTAAQRSVEENEDGWAQEGAQQVALPGIATKADPGADFSRFGVVANIVGKVDDQNQGFGIQTRVGVRYGLFERTSRGNLAVALLVGGGAANTRGERGMHGTLGLDARLEGMWAGQVVPLLPVVMGYLTTGATFDPSGDFASEFHVGVGLGWSLLVTGVVRLSDFSPGSGDGFWSGWGGGGGLGAVGALLIVAVAAILAAAVAAGLAAMMPTAELRYTVRSDGSAFGSLLFGVGI